jgi:prevent-host-death family protein
MTGLIDWSSMRTITASDLKATCLALLDEVSRTGEPVTITKRGRPVARLVPARQPDGLAELGGTVEIVGDIIAPVLSPDAWEAEGANS